MSSPSRVIELNNGIPYSESNLGPVINQGDLVQFIKAQKQVDGFRLSAVNFFVFYHNYIHDKGLLTTFFNNIKPVTEMIISHNHGSTYCFLNYTNAMKKPFNSSVIGVYDFNGCRPEIFTFTKDGISYSKKWIQRADPSFVPKAQNESKSVFDKYSECETQTEVLKKISKPSDVGGAIQAWNIIKNEKGFSDEYIQNYKPWGWHHHLYSMVQNSANERSILWYYNSKPKLGKSTIGYYLMVKFPKHFYVIGNPSYVKDTSTVLLNAMKGGWNGHCIIINLTMSYDGIEWLYGVLEAIKDPIFSTAKYNGGTTIKGMTHVVVFSNFEPNPYDKNGKPLIDPERIIKLQIPIPTTPDPNPPREIKRVVDLIDLPMSDEDKLALEECNKQLKSGSDIPIKPKELEGDEDKDKVVNIDFVKINKDCSKIKKTEYVKKVYNEEDRLWKPYLNKEEGSLNSAGREVKHWQVLLNSSMGVKDSDLVVASWDTHKKYRLFNEGTMPVKNFFAKYYYGLEESKRTLFEVILNNNQKPYFDIDIPSNMGLDDEYELIKQLKEAIIKTYDRIKITNIMVFNSHGTNKRSYHVIVDKFFMINCTDNNDFAQEVLTYIDPKLIAFGAIDFNVYKRVQQMRMYGSHKYVEEGKEYRIKKLDPKFNTWKDEMKGGVPDKVREFNILRGSLITHDTGCQLILRKVDEKPKYDGPTKNYNTEEIERVKKVVEEKYPGIFKYSGEKGNSLFFERLKPSMCPIHKRVHDHQNVLFKIKERDNKIYYRCFNVTDSDSVKEIEV